MGNYIDPSEQIILKNIVELRLNPAKYMAIVQNIMWKLKTDGLAFFGIYEDMKIDNNLILATIDDKVIITRMDMLPMSGKAIEWQLDNWIGG